MRLYILKVKTAKKGVLFLQKMGNSAILTLFCHLICTLGLILLYLYLCFILRVKKPQTLKIH